MPHLTALWSHASGPGRQASQAGAVLSLPQAAKAVLSQVTDLRLGDLPPHALPHEIPVCSENWAQDLGHTNLCGGSFSKLENTSYLDHLLFLTI